MKYSLLMAWAVLFHLPPGLASGSDGKSSTEKDSLTDYLEHKEFVRYFKMMRRQFNAEVQFALTDDKITPQEKQALLDFASPLLSDFSGLSVEEKYQLRHSRMVVGALTSRKMNDYLVALNYQEKAHALVADPRSLDTLAWHVENALMNIYNRFSDYEKALSFVTPVENSLKLYNYTERLCRFYVNAGLIFQSAGRLAEAKNYFEKGSALADSIQFLTGRFANEIALAQLYIGNNQIHEGKAHLLEAKSIVPSIEKKDSPNHDRRSQLQFAYGEIEFKNQRYFQSITYYKNAITELVLHTKSRNGREFAKLCIPLSKAYLYTNSLELAEQTVFEGLSALLPEYSDYSQLPAPTRLYRENSFIELFSIKSEIELKGATQSPEDPGRLISALAYIDLALLANDKIRLDILADPSKLLAIRENKTLCEKGLNTIYSLYIQTGEYDLYFQKARAYFDRSKSLLYDEKANKRSWVDLMSSADIDELKTLNYQIFELLNSKYNSTGPTHDSNVNLLKLQERVDSIYKKYKKEGDNIVYPERYIEYAVTGNYIYVISEINQRKIFLRIDDTRKLDSLIWEMNEFIALKGLSGNSNILQQLYTFLIEPVTQDLPSAVTIIPDGQICFIPFDALIDRKGQYLIESATISYLFRFENYVQPQKTRASRMQIFCLAPEYPLDPDQSAEQRGGLYHLNYVNDEITAIREIYGEDMTVSTSTDKRQWLEQIRKSDIFHYAGHAIVENDQAYLAFGAGASGHRLTDGEISSLMTPLNMVVLSACETGLGKIEYGEGVRSLGKSFMEAGAASAIYSLWTVNDRSTSNIMRQFYKYLREGKTKDVALRQAKLDYIASVKEINKHPYFWAPFVAAGDMGIMIRNKGGFSYLLFFIGIACLAAVVLVLRFRK